LNCTIPALVNSRVGSSPGMSEELRTTSWPLELKYSRNVFLIAALFILRYKPRLVTDDFRKFIIRENEA